MAWIGLALLAIAGCKHPSADAPAPTLSNPNNPARATCRVAVISDSALSQKTEEVLYDADKRPMRVNFFDNNVDNDLRGYYTYAYNGTRLTVSAFRPDGTVDPTVGHVSAIVEDGLVTQYVRTVNISGTDVIDSVLVTYDTLGLPVRLATIARNTPAGGTTQRVYQQLDFTSLNGAVTHIELTYAGQPYPDDSTQYLQDSYDLAYGNTPAVKVTPLLGFQVLPGYLLYLGNKLPVSYSYRARNRLGHSITVPSTLTATVDAGGFPTRIRTVTRNDARHTDINTKLYSYSCL